MVIDVNDKNFESEVTNAKGKVLVDFNANWCGPCQMLKPIIENLSEEKQNIKFVSINVDGVDELNHKYNVSSIPCLILFKDGKELKRTVGFISENDLKNWIDE